jgi:hypothetical protein
MANTIWNSADKTANVTLTGSSLIATASSNGWVRAVDKQITGKFYWECKPTVWANSSTGVGFCQVGVATPTNVTAGVCAVIKNGTIWIDGASSGSTLSARVANDIIGIAVDFAARLAWFRVAPSGNWNGNASADPATAVGGLSTPPVGIGIPGFPLAILGANLESVTANFGDSAFTGTVPSGFTSGFTAGATPSVNVLATQVVLEHWASVAAAGTSADQARVMVMA